MNTASDRANGSAARWSLRLLGGFELAALASGERLSLPGKRERVLLAYLALHGNGRAARRKLAALLWPDTAEETALHNLRNCLLLLRKALGDAHHRVVSSEGEEIGLDLAAFETDVLAFRRLASKPGRAEAEAAAKLCTGDLLDGIGIESEEFESWRSGEAVRHREQSVEVLTRLTGQLDEAGETERAIETATRILTLEPLHEPAARRLMRLYGRSGRRGAAVGVYRALASALRTELGVEPEAETRAVFAEISRGMEAGGDKAPSPPSTERSADPPPAPPPVQESPPAVAASLPAKRRSLFRIAAGVLAGAALAFLLSQLGAPRGIATPQQAAANADKGDGSLSGGVISVAVLPFTNLSGDSSQEFFSDGITEEVTSALTKVPNLRVVARSSAFGFKSQDRDIRKVAQSLGATHVIEGSVRKEGGRVRITAHLVDAGQGADIWSENYDRQLTDIFAIQEEIARAIAAALRMPLRLEGGRNLVNNRNIDPVSYEKLLRAKALFDGRNGSQFAHETAETLLQEVIAKNPDHPPALALLGATYYMRASTQVQNINEPVSRMRAQVDDLREKGEAAARRALQIDPTLSWGYATLGILTWSRAKPAETEALYRKALALDPTDYYLLDGWAIRLGAAGRLQEALGLLEKALAIEPFQPGLLDRMAEDLWLNGRNDDAIALAKTLRANDRAPTLAMIYASMGRYREAADALTEISGDPNSAAAQAARLLRTAPAKAKSPDTLPNFPTDLDFVYLHVGAPERALATYERRAEIGFLGGNYLAYVWHPSYATARKTERFKALMRKVGLAGYWREKGWPEQCHPTAGDDFACD